MKTDKKIYAEGKWRKVHINQGYYTFHLYGKKVLLHRYFYQAYHKCSILPGIDVHHIDGDKLNNHPHNLELKCHKEHIREHKLGNKNTFNGGSADLHKTSNRWRARVYENKKQKYIGSFATQEKAREALNKYYSEREK